MGPVRYIVYVLPVLTIAALFFFTARYWQTQRALLPQRIAGEGAPRRRFSFARRCHPMERRDALPVLLITAVYAVTAFANLGSLRAPQSAADLAGGASCTLELDREIYLTRLWYFSNLGTGAYNVEISTDGTHWSTLWSSTDENGGVSHYWADAAGYEPNYALSQKYNQLFKWLELKPDNPQYVRYLRVTGRSDRDLLELGELALFDENGARVDAYHTAAGRARALVDEQHTVPQAISWENSAYFDEIYHARTALEHIENVPPYEISHPPLGKLILGLGIRLFGMTPFGWRFMGALFGVGMVPLLYVFLKNLFGRTAVAACGAILLAADFMHLTQTRIATIDTYGVFFILLMYYFMYRYLTLPAGTPFRACALPLFLSGLFWGIGAASKWTVIYGCVGLAALYFIGLYQKLRDWPEQARPARLAWTVKLLGFSVLCFAVIPAFIYTLSYLPYATARGDASLGGLLEVMWENQKYMFTYHKGVTDTHPYSSRWYQWLLDIRPILYYLDSSVPGYTTRFGAFVNPVVCWGGLLAMVSMTVQMVRRRCGRALFILAGYLSQLAPWLLIGRITFEYHYFPSVLFLILALCYLFNDLAEREITVNWRGAVYGVTGGAVALYALFYPVLTGLTIPTWYAACFLRWFPSWPF